MNRLVSIAQSGQSTVYYTYRPDGLRATKQIGTGAVTRYVYDGQSLIAEKDSSGNVKVSYTIGKGEVISRTDWSGQTPATVFFLYDGNCNLDAVVDEGGNLVKQFTYDVFGAVRETLVGSGAERTAFSGGIGHITDLENSLVYMRAKYYDPALGRFISKDPGCNGTNWYIYCGNNPVNAVDPTGTNAAQVMYYLAELYVAMSLSPIFRGAMIAGLSIIAAGPALLIAALGSALGVEALCASFLAASWGVGAGWGTALSGMTELLAQAGGGLSGANAVAATAISAAMAYNALVGLTEEILDAAIDW